MNFTKQDLQRLIDIDYATDVRVSRRKGSGGTQEFYTPFSIVEKMCLKIPEEDWQDPTKTFLEPSAGNGNFVLAIIYYRMLNGINWMTALKTCYSVELCEDNVIEQRGRVHELLRNIVPEYDPDIANLIMDKNFVCHDFFTWNFEEWREMTDEEIRKANVKPKKEKPKKKDLLQLEINFK